MKKLIFLLLILFIGLEIFSQEKSQPKKSVLDFFNTVEDYSKDYNRFNRNELLKSKNYTNQEAFYLAEQYYKAKAEDPIGFYNYQNNKRKEFEENKNVNKSDLMLPEKVGIIYRIISSKYGRAFTDIIVIPWYLKVYVIDIKHGEFKSSIGTLGKTYLVAKVEEVIKGKDFFKEGEIIEVNFLGNWLSDAGKQFEKNKSYFMGLREWNCYNGNCTEIALYVFPDKDHGIYPIEDGHVIAPNNYFGIENNLPWSMFKSEFVKKYILE